MDKNMEESFENIPDAIEVTEEGEGEEKVELSREEWKEILDRDGRQRFPDQPRNRAA